MDASVEAQRVLHAKHAKDYACVRRHCIGTRLMNDAWNRQIMLWLPKDPTLDVLDNMCGTGELLEPLSFHYPRAMGCDLSPEMLSQVRVNAWYQLRQADANELPYPVAFFDAVIVRGALHHVNPCGQALDEMRRVLRSGGILILSEPCDDNPIIAVARRLLYRNLPSYFDANEHTFTSAELDDLVKAHGFTIEARQRFGCFAYALLGFPDILPCLRWLQRLPGIARFSKLLIAIDAWIARTPIIQRACFVYSVKARVAPSAELHDH